MLKTSKQDLWFCTIALLFAGIFCALVYLPIAQNPGDTVEIYQNGILSETLSLSKDQNLDLTNEAISLELEIRDGAVRVTRSSCSGQDCVHIPAISHAGQSILCAPQKVLILIRSDGTIDAVVS